MDQFIPVAGPSQDDFDTMSGQIANKITTGTFLVKTENGFKEINSSTIISGSLPSDIRKAVYIVTTHSANITPVDIALDGGNKLYAIADMQQNITVRWFEFGITI